MESVAHSRQPNKVSVTFPKKTTNGNFSTSKTLYDDVYGGPPKFAASSISPRFEDYREIFASFHAVRASSIPVLDLPAVDAGDVFFDFCSGFDYAEVFRGFDGLDFWSSHEDLFRDGLSDEEEEAWTRTETDSFSGDLDHFRNNQGIPSGDLFQSVDENTEFNMSYHKVNGTSKTDMSKGRTYITPLHAVPGFTHLVDETTDFQKHDPSLQIVDDIELDMEFHSGKAKRTHHRKGKENPSLQVVDDIELDMEFTAGKAKRTHHRKMMSQTCNVTSGEQVLCCDLDPHDGCSRNDSHTSEMFITVSDINLATLPSHMPPPLRPPPALDASKGYTSGFHSNNERIDSEDIRGGGSPPFFDVEVDINSSAAVVKEAMDRPETRRRSTKELKRRKKGVCDSNIKPSYDVKTNVAKISENITTFNSLNDERLPATYDQRSSTKKIAATVERQKARKAAPEISEPSEGECLLNILEEKRAKESRSSQESEQSTGVGTWTEATEFFELVGTNEFGKVILPINHTMSLVHDTATYVHGSKEASNIQDEYKKVKATVESYQPECKKKSKAARGVYEQGKNFRRSKSSKEESKQREHGKDDELAEFFQLETSEKKTRMVHLHGKTETKVIKADQSGTLKDMVETQPKELKRVGNEKSEEGDGQTLSEVQCSLKLNKNENKLKQNEEQKLSMKKQKQSQIMKENEKIQKEALAPEEAARDAIRVQDFEELGKMNEKSNETLKLDKREEHATCEREYEIILKQAKQIENKKGLKEACENEEFEKRLKSSYKKEESDKGRQRAHGLVENETRHKVDLEPGLNKTKPKEAFKQGENEACEKDQSTEKLGEFHNEYGNRLNERGGNKGTRDAQKQASELESNSGNEVQMKHEIESPSNQAYDREGNASTSNEDSHSKQSEKILKDANKNEKYEGFDKALEQKETNGEGTNTKFAKHSNETQETDSDENLLAAHSSSIPEENIGKLDVSQEPVADREIGEARTDCKIDGRKSEDTGVENIIANGKIRASEMPEGKEKHSRTEKVDRSVANTDELRFSSEQVSTEKNMTISEMEFDPSNQERKVALEWGEKGMIKQHANVVINQEESKDRNSPTQVNPRDDYRRNSLADEPAAVQEAVNVQNTSQRSRVAHSIKTEEMSLNETPVSVEKDAEKIRRERELEKDRLRKIEEMERERERQKDRMAVNRETLEAEREREREKDRMAVEKATFEARDRAYMEARERAERAAFERKTAEARQRALNEARERLEKACAEARDKSYTDKAAAEARLKAERAAVERATAEARERAMEKVKVERTAFVSRERLERSVSDKFGVSFRNDGRQGSSSSDMQDPHFQNPGSSTGSRYPYSVSGASSFIERSEGEGESAQRCRARLERHRRTSERAAKALEEKNMRDLLAQKEQSERNRLAETLDSEVRRWSSGKEGNLRALLSTLQYILGNDSGWQPIPLTEVITSAAVKKAYRKATLCVHPDKLQQRGASIQHKYICEKVFDLLKEAWNKFNSEER